jgi:[protein-PII] uridylyltransferase
MQGYYRAASQVERLGVQVAERFEEMLEHLAMRCRWARLRALRHASGGARSAAFHATASGVGGHLHRAAGSAGRHRLQCRHHAAHPSGHRGAWRCAARPIAMCWMLFCILLRRGAPAVDALWRMNRHGLLAAILPAFGKVFGRMQYDLFHVYTVDEHTLRVLRNMARFADPAAQREFRWRARNLARRCRSRILLLAALFHDIAKGRGGDHSVLGEDDARAFCAQLGLPRPISSAWPGWCAGIC